ncbi:hypothetical protein PHLGIDRAFT_123659 [Phlebiopsis gigantea 11061_1 CR5-6]|uniref:Protein kinase domain-containing protein n=1 Tax=Phlebiopsis gigantea (strain 11061_1 CR5-6) TaxID=745531 RepID=A0A0C3N9E6_PHLG1|nr:hypothetical protein PHLGIDRAFT_123659 [Phlebiopsis gigantea 11061_1 CR5-6]
MADIRAAAEEKVPEHKIVLDRALLTLEQSWEVPVDGVVDHTHNLMLRGKTPTVQEIVRVKANAEECKKVVTEKPVVGSVYVPQALGQKLLQYPAKVHYRLVYKEVGKTIDQLDSMHDVFRCLCDVVKGLSAMHAAGYVHRDISAGNILVVDGKGILGDVEYAKEEDDNSQHEVRTGTAYFMAIEVNLHAYVHKPTRRRARKGVGPNLVAKLSGAKQEDDVLPAWSATGELKHNTTRTSLHLNTIVEDELPRRHKARVAKRAPRPAFKYNPLHDLESVWWVAVYVWLCSCPVKNDAKMDQAAWSERLQAHARLATRVFRNNDFRRSFLSVEDTLTEELELLLPSFAAIGEELDAVRETIMCTYLEAEEDTSMITFQVAEHAYEDILDSLSAIQASLAGEKDIKLSFTDTRAMDEYLAGLANKHARPTPAGDANGSEDANDNECRPSKIHRTQHSGTVSLGAPSSARGL